MSLSERIWGAVTAMVKLDDKVDRTHQQVGVDQDRLQLQLAGERFVVEHIGEPQRAVQIHTRTHTAERDRLDPIRTTRGRPARMEAHPQRVVHELLQRPTCLAYESFDLCRHIRVQCQGGPHANTIASGSPKRHGITAPDRKRFQLPATSCQFSVASCGCGAHDCADDNYPVSDTSWLEAWTAAYKRRRVQFPVMVVHYCIDASTGRPTLKRTACRNMKSRTYWLGRSKTGQATAEHE